MARKQSARGGGCDEGAAWPPRLVPTEGAASVLHPFYSPTERLHRLASGREPRPSSLIRSSHAITPVSQSEEEEDRGNGTRAG